MSPPIIRRLYLALILVLFSVYANAQTAAPLNVGRHRGTDADRKAIEQLLETYTQSVTNGDRKRFESLLLQPDIPFFSTSKLPTQDEAAKTFDIHDYRSFKAAIFDSGKRFHQQFYNLRIEQDKDLAQVSLDFVTSQDGSIGAGYGWKILQLIRIQGNWKIASEFYTAYALEDKPKRP